MLLGYWLWPEAGTGVTQWNWAGWHRAPDARGLVADPHVVLAVRDRYCGVPVNAAPTDVSVVKYECGCGCANVQTIVKACTPVHAGQHGSAYDGLRNASADTCHTPAYE